MIGQLFHKLIQVEMAHSSQWVLGVALGVVAAGAGYLMGGLTPAGGLAAALVGALTMGGGGLAPSILLLLFFFSSSALSRYGAERKRGAQSYFSKQARRDQGQVLANGAVAAGFSVGLGLGGDQAWFVGLAGALAAVTADTWATELGVLAGGRPRLITTGKSVEPGTSGGVSLLGSTAAIGGALLIAVVAGGLRMDLGVVPAALIGGIAGATTDSILGATVQAIYECPHCQKETERHPLHTCGTQTVRARGWVWMDNDIVNFVASVVGALVAIGVWLGAA